MKTLITLCLASLTLILYSQEAEKPNWMFGGIVGYSNEHKIPYSISGSDYSIGEESQHTTFILQPYLGRIVNHRWIVGIKSRYTYSIDKYDISTAFTSSAKTHTGSIGPFARFLINPQNKLVFQIEPCYFLNFGETALAHAEGDVDKIRTLSHSWAISPLATYAVAPRIVLAVRFSAVRYETGYWKIIGSSEKNNFDNLDINLNINKLQMGVALLF